MAGGVQVAPTKSHALAHATTTTTPPALCPDNTDDPSLHPLNDPFLVYCSTPVFACWWTGVLVFHALCVMFYALWAFAYTTMYTTIGLTLQISSFALRMDQFPYVAGVYALFAVPHASHLLWMVGCSLRQRRLVFGNPPAPQATPQQQQARPKDATVATCDHRVKAYLSKLVDTLVHAFFHHEGLFGIASSHFHMVFLMQEMFEIILQSIQAYRLTKWVSRAWLIRSYTAVIVINCWSTMAIQRMFKKDPVMQRLLCRAWDMVMDFISTVLVPVTMALPYFLLYDPSVGQLDPNAFYDNLFLINALNEFRVFLVSTWFDMANVVGFSFLLLDCLHVVKSSVRARRLQSSARVSTWAAAQSTQDDPRHDDLQAHGVRASHRFVRWMHRLFVLWGITIAVVHLHAKTRASSPGCRRQVYPWFESRAACSFLQLHCVDAGISGTAAEMQQHMLSMVPEMVLIAEFRHCAALEIVPELRSFTQLIGLRVYASNLVRWDEDAALMEPYFPMLNILYVVKTRLPDNQLPRGLYAGKLPAKLTDLEFPATNLSTLPENLDQIWTSPVVLVLDSNKFQQVPDVVTRLQVEYLSFVNNQLTKIPPGIIFGSGIRSLWMNGNPIQFLPDSHKTIQQKFMRLRLQHSNLTTPLPKWFATFLQVNEGVVRLANTPICDRIASSEASLPADASAATKLAALAWLGDAAPFVESGGINCEPDEGDDYTYYPMELEASFDEP